jgi:4'-phosphopantetheinyl transferase
VSSLESSTCEVRAWTCRPSQQGADDFALAVSALDDWELARAERFRFAEDRAGYLIAHGLLRLVLSRYLGRQAREVQFRRSPNCRPELASTDGATRRLRFSLAHTRGLVGCAVAWNWDVGFDLEGVREPAPTEIADSCFRAEESHWMREGAPESESVRFFTLWTLKEAYVKARGLGLALPLRSFLVRPLENGSAELTSMEQDPDPWPWYLWHWKLERHAAALAVRAPPPAPPVALFENTRISSVLERSED